MSRAAALLACSAHPCQPLPHTPSRASLTGRRGNAPRPRWVRARSCLSGQGLGSPPTAATAEMTGGLKVSQAKRLKDRGNPGRAEQSRHPTLERSAEGGSGDICSPSTPPRVCRGGLRGAGHQRTSGPQVPSLQRTLSCSLRRRRAGACIALCHNSSDDAVGPRRGDGAVPCHEVERLTHPHGGLCVLDVQDEVVRARADDLHARATGCQVLGPHVLLAECDDSALAMTPVFPVPHTHVGVWADGAYGHPRLAADFDDFGRYEEHFPVRNRERIASWSLQGLLGCTPPRAGD